MSTFAFFGLGNPYKVIFQVVGNKLILVLKLIIKSFLLELLLANILVAPAFAFLCKLY